MLESKALTGTFDHGREIMEGFDCEVISGIEILGVKGRGRVGDTRGELETPRQRERMAAFPTEEVAHFTVGKKQ